MLETTGSITANPAQAATVSLVQYWHHDHLGSTVAVTDGAGALRSRHAYDPFGKRRQVWGQYDEFGTLVFDHGQGASAYATDRGFTLHEHLDDVGIIHMNATCSLKSEVAGCSTPSQADSSKPTLSSKTPHTCKASTATRM